MERTYSTAKVCEMFEISKSTLFRWEREKVGWLPPVRRDINDERQYTSDHIEAIRKYLNKKKYRSATSAEDVARLGEVEEKATLRKFISQRELATLHNLGERELSDETIKQLLQIALEDYSPRNDVFREIIKVIYEQVTSTEPGLSTETIVQKKKVRR